MKYIFILNERAGKGKCTKVLPNIERACKDRNINFSYPKIKYCTDNAAMIGAAAYYAYKKGIRADLTLNAVAVDTLYNEE